MRYIPNATSERESMLNAIGVANVAELFRGIPEELLLNRPLNVAPAQSEMELIETFSALAGQNRNPEQYASFLGGGVYDHVRPLIVDTLVSRSEFYTSYTPYQPEINQGTLQAIFEYQTFICQLTGMDVSNASMYDGATSLAEAVLMAVRVVNRDKAVMAGTIHPEYQAVCDTYMRRAGVKVVKSPIPKTGVTSPADLAIDERTAAVVVQSPNFFGCIEDLKPLADAAHKAGAVLIVCVAEAMSLGILTAPGDSGADIVVGEGQSFGIAPNFGGPHLGFFAARERFARQMPGRLIGEAHDKDGHRGYVITMATREQHIRREKATSNICSNEGLCALTASVYLSTVGRRGLREIAHRNLQKASYALSEITTLTGFSRTFSGPVFNEFVITTPAPAEHIVNELLECNILAGLPLSKYFPERTHELLICVTENMSRKNIDRLVFGVANVAEQARNLAIV
jgi:glycine dehydrogenase subunit 1